MSRARISLALGHVLRTQAFRDSSLLVEAFTEEHGRIGLVARGARSPQSRKRALLQPFQPLLLSWTEQGDLGSLTAIEAAAPPVPLAGELVFSGWYLNEILLRLVQRHDPHPVLYAAYGRTLHDLAAATEASLRIFEKQLLAELGYGLQLFDDLLPDQHYRYDDEEGPVPVGPEAPGALSGDSLIALRDERFETPQQLRQARQLLRASLRPLLGTQELESARLLKQLRARGGAS